MKLLLCFAVLTCLLVNLGQSIKYDEEIYLEYHRRQPKLFALLRKYFLWPPNVTLVEPLRDPAIEPFIVGGDSTTIDAYPYQLSMRNGGVHICGASIVADKWALTAAHCLDDGTSPPWITFRGGSPHRLAGGYIFHATQIVLHQKYVAVTFNYDVAVVKIAENFLVDFLQPIPLVDNSIVTGCPSAAATVIGWGTAAYDYVPLILQELKVLIQPQKVCNTMWIEQITDKMLCAGGVEGQDTCNGDSGGPLICNGYQIGIVSWGSSKCAIAMPAVFTDLANTEIRDFIRQYAGV